MAKKAMINKEKRREELAAKGKYPTVRLHNSKLIFFSFPHS